MAYLIIQCVLIIRVDTFIGDVMKSITEHLLKYQIELQQLKNAGMEVVGYVRKSKSTKAEKPGDRVRLLQQMVERLKERSHCDKVFVSPFCSSHDILSSRDLPRPVDILQNLKNVSGTMQGRRNRRKEKKSANPLCRCDQDLFAFLTIAERDVCLVALDFAGLTTNNNDLHDFIK